jgi:hypothetical protein
MTIGSYKISRTSLAALGAFVAYLALPLLA